MVWLHICHGYQCMHITIGKHIIHVYIYTYILHKEQLISTIHTNILFIHIISHIMSHKTVTSIPWLLPPSAPASHCLMSSAVAKLWSLGSVKGEPPGISQRHWAAAEARRRQEATAGVANMAPGSWWSKGCISGDVWMVFHGLFSWCSGRMVH